MNTGLIEQEDHFVSEVIDGSLNCIQHFGLIGLNFPVEWKFNDGNAEAGEREEFCKIFMRLLKDGSQKIDSRNKFLFEFVSIEQL